MGFLLAQLFNRILPVFKNTPNHDRVKIILFFNASRTLKRLSRTGSELNMAGQEGKKRNY